MMILAPSILAADFKELGKEIQTIEENGAQYLHFDVMDGVYFFWGSGIGVYPSYYEACV